MGTWQNILGLIGFLVFIIVGVFAFIIPSIKCAKKIVNHNSEENGLPIKRIEIFALVVMPILGYLSLFIFRELGELLDWKYIAPILFLTFISIGSYFISRKNKHIIGPLLLALIPTTLTIGILLAIVQFIHFSPFLLLGAGLLASPLFFISAFVLPAFSLIQAAILLSAELYSSLQYNKSKVLNDNKRSKWINKLMSIYFGKYSLIVQLISFPIFITIVQYFFIILTEKPDDIIQAFIESSDGLFSKGRNDNQTSPSEYICTIAGYGSSKLVKPLHLGYRRGSIIRVTRQLQVCNAFEEMLTEKVPKTQKFLRKKYDSLQIPIEKWKQVKLISNSLYILIKPMEWTFLIALYLFDKKPETKIAKQYLPMDLK